MVSHTRFWHIQVLAAPKSVKRLLTRIMILLAMSKSRKLSMSCLWDLEATAG